MDQIYSIHITSILYPLAPSPRQHSNHYIFCIYIPLHSLLASLPFSLLPLLFSLFPLFSWSYMEMACLQGCRMTLNSGSSWFLLAEIAGLWQHAQIYEVLGLDARVLCMVGKYSTTWSTLPAVSYCNDIDSFTFCIWMKLHNTCPSETGIF